jgi:hypothetical protein
MKKLYVLLALFMAVFLHAQPVNLQTTTQINLTYNNVSLAGVSDPSPVSLSLNNAASINDGVGLQGPVFGTSALQYFHYTMFGRTGISRSINVSLQSNLASDYYLLVLQTGTSNTPAFGSLPQTNTGIQLSTLPKTWISQLDFGASGTLSNDGIPFYYELQENAAGNYGTLTGGNVQTNIIFTIVE